MSKNGDDVKKTFLDEYQKDTKGLELIRREINKGGLPGKDF